MQPYDLLMLVVLVTTAVYGLWKGMAWQVTSLASLLASSFIAVRFGEPLAPYFSKQEPWNRFLAMLTLFLITSLLVWLAFRMVRGLIDRLRLQEFDRQIGALFGLAKGALCCIVITFFAVTLSEPARRAVLASRSGHYISVFLRDAKPILPEKVRSVLGGYIDELQKTLQTAPGNQPPSGGQPADQKGPLPASDNQSPLPTTGKRTPK
jgi:membrane protein required for colicin V production